MLLAWMIYALFVASLAAAAAVSAERLVPRSSRWAWAFALAVGGVIPLVRAASQRWGRGDPGVSVALGPMVPVVDAALASLGALAGSATAAQLQVPLAAIWLSLSVGLLVVLGFGWVRLRVQEREWEPGELWGTQVLLSEDLGPAVVGLVRPRIVLPRWVADLPPEEGRLILVHEEEHRRKKDPALLAGALLVPLFAPWNPFLWFGFFRLRHAVELDCDARVLTGGERSALGYAELLIHVGTSPGRPVPFGAGFGERKSSLERRIRTMLEEKRKGGAGASVVRALLAGVLVFAACSVDMNVQPAEEDAGDPNALVAPETAPAQPIQSKGELDAKPVPTPFTTGPVLLNRDEVIKAMEKSYPPLLREAGVSGTVRLYFFIDETGRVTKTLVDQSSGHEALDEAAARVAGTYLFEPALNREKKVPVWVSFPITFQVR